MQRSDSCPHGRSYWSSYHRWIITVDSWCSHRERERAEETLSDWLAGWLTDWMFWLTYYLINWLLIVWLASWITNIMTGGLSGSLTDSPTDWIECLAIRLNNRLTTDCWLICWSPTVFLVSCGLTENDWFTDRLTDVLMTGWLNPPTKANDKNNILSHSHENSLCKKQHRGEVSVFSLYNSQTNQPQHTLKSSRQPEMLTGCKDIEIGGANCPGHAQRYGMALPEQGL